MPFAGLRKFQRTVSRQLTLFPKFVFVEKVTAEKVIALTFDDGPDPFVTPRLLKALRDAEVKATFFLVGRLAKRYPKLVKAIVEEGHAVAGHGFTHTDHREKSAADAFQYHLEPTNKILEKHTGQQIEYFRPPYGAMKDEQIRYFGDKGVRTILWSVDSLDWHREHATAKKVEKRVLEQAHPGAIVLLHSGSGRTHTTKALPKIIRGLKKRGYCFASVNELLTLEGACW